MPGQPSFVSTSLWQIPQACTLMSTCPAPGLGISRSTISKSPPALGTCATFIGAIPIFVVAMMPPSTSYVNLVVLTTVMMMPKGGSFPAFAQLLGRCGLCQFSGLDTLEKVVVDRSSPGAKDRPALAEPTLGCSIR